jgi:hypothetical protein
VRAVMPNGVDAAIDVAGSGIIPELIRIVGDAAHVLSVADFSAEDLAPNSRAGRRQIQHVCWPRWRTCARLEYLRCLSTEAFRWIGRPKRSKSASRAMSPVRWSFVSPDARRGRSLAVIYATVALDAAGIGLVFPILPRLIREVTHSPDVAPHVGWMAALYAVTPFVFAPVLGALSDRLGRRPVLLVSLVGAPINYGVMALAPQL